MFLANSLLPSILNFKITQQKIYDIRKNFSFTFSFCDSNQFQIVKFHALLQLEINVLK